MNDWTNKERKHINNIGRPRMEDKKKKRQPMNISVHPNVRMFLEGYYQETGIRPGRLIDKMMSDSFAVEIDDSNT